MKKMMYAIIALGAFGILEASMSGESVGCIDVVTQDIDYVRKDENQTDLQACKKLGKTYVPLYGRIGLKK